ERLEVTGIGVGIGVGCEPGLDQGNVHTRLRIGHAREILHRSGGGNDFQLDPVAGKYLFVPLSDGVEAAAFRTAADRERVRWGGMNEMERCPYEHCAHEDDRSNCLDQSPPGDIAGFRGHHAGELAFQFHGGSRSRSYWRTMA